MLGVSIAGGGSRSMAVASGRVEDGRESGDLLSLGMVALEIRWAVAREFECEVDAASGIHLRPGSL